MRTIIFLAGCVVGAIIAITVMSWILIYREEKK